MADLEQAFQDQRELNESLREAQGELSTYEAELEAELKARETEINQQKEELERLKRLSQVCGPSKRKDAPLSCSFFTPLRVLQVHLAAF